MSCRLLLPKRQVITSVGEVGEEKEPLFTAGGNVNWYSTIENSIKVPQKIKNRALAGVAQWIEHWILNQRVIGWIPSLGHMPGLQARSPVVGA